MQSWMDTVFEKLRGYDEKKAARFMLEVAKDFGRGNLKFYDEEEYARLQKLYGSMKHLQTLGKED